MPPEKGRKPRLEAQRRWRVPPPLLRDSAAPGPEGLAVLEEIRNETGMILWKSLRSVLLWGQAGPGGRRGLFPDDLAERRHLEIISSVPDEESDLREALENLTLITSEPERTDPEVVGLACRQIAAWAEEQQAPRTQMEFLQAAAVCCPANARFALAVGRAVRDMAQYSRAEAWLHRAIGLARQAKDWETYVWGYIGHGTMMLRRGALPAARRSYTKALRRASRQGLRELQGHALHDFFVLEDKAGDTEAALDYANRALSVFGARHRGLPHLAHDVAVFWMQRGHFDSALPVLQESVRRVDERCRGIALGSLARAAGHVGDQRSFDWAVGELDRWWDGPGIADAWAEVARGAVALDRLDQARTAAKRAETMARKRGENLVRFEAEALLESIRAERKALSARERKELELVSAGAGELARRLVTTLQAQPARA